MRDRTLVLRKETLTELAAEELAGVVGGTSNACVTYTIIPTGCWCTGIWPSLNVDCKTTDAIGDSLLCK